MEDAFNRFFKKQNGFPKFKTKRKAKKSYTTKFTNNNIKIENNFIQIPKLGIVKFVVSKSDKNNSKLNKIEQGLARILNATISYQGGKYYISLCLEETVDLIRLKDITI